MSEPFVPASPADSPGSLREALPIFARHASPRLLTAAVLACGTARVALGGFSLWDLVPVAVIAALWPVQEWLIHVYVLHSKPFRFAGRSFDPRVPRKHRAHHRDPWNYEILFIPVHSFVYSLPILVALCFLLTPSTELALTALTFHLLCALHYEIVHFLVHTRVAPRTRYYKALWRNHRLHHFKNEHYGYGVTRLEADRWLGTAPDWREVATSPTARSLVGGEPTP